MNISDDIDVAVRSKSYNDNVWMGDLMIWRVDRNAVAVVWGHSSWRPIQWLAKKEQEKTALEEEEEKDENKIYVSDSFVCFKSHCLLWLSIDHRTLG